MTPFPDAEALSAVRYVLTDIDDTLTRDGFLQPEAFKALWDLRQKGYMVIPVTGRPAGWCDCIIRQWPVAAVIGENGAFAYVRDGQGKPSMLIHPALSEADTTSRLRELGEYVQQALPEARIAKDQPYRRYDLAIDFAEDPPVFGLDFAIRIKELCEEKGAVAKISSIHVNAWYGNYDKLGMARYLLEHSFEVSADKLCSSVLYCGDSPNDEPMFSFFPLSFGVSNILEYWDLLKDKPSYVTRESHGEGFLELADKLPAL